MSCYKLVGFFMRGSEIFFAIESNCEKNSKSRMLHLVKSYLNPKTLEINNCFELFASYNLYQSAINNNISKCKAKKLRASGFSYKNGELYILTNYRKSGYLWSVDMCGCKDKLKLKRCCGDILKLEKYPVGLTHLDNEHLFVIGNTCHNKQFNYYIVKIPFKQTQCKIQIKNEITLF